MDPDAITQVHWSDLATDFSLNIGGFERARRELLDRVAVESPRLRDEARAEGWYHPAIDNVLGVIVARGTRVV